MDLPAKTPFPKRPSGNGLAWKIFILLVSANGVISFSPLSLGMKSAVGIFFLAIPLLFLYKKVPFSETRAGAILNMDFLPAPPGIVWILAVVLAVVFRFWDLTSLSVWPTSDEGWINYLALQLSKKWNWNLFFASFQVPPVHFWGQALFFRWFGPSLFTLWLFPAFLSLVTLGLIYGAARIFFSSRFSFLCFLLASVNYWFLWNGRLSVSTADVVVPFECGSLICMGLALRKNHPGYRNLWPFLWGLATGFCLYTAVESVFFVGAMGLTVLGAGWKNKPARRGLWPWFGAGF
ncbi:MAG TPA: glycosyltransferase family 39 protein, partial [bacterium]|nr:glycosyltransferase family 39 protein [bacterium]